MKLPTQLVNLLGIVVTAAIAATGLLLIALPLWSQAQTTQAERRTVAQTNDVYEAQVVQLEAAAGRLTEIATDVDALRRGIPASPELDGVHELVGVAAEETGATVVSVVASELGPWTPRTEMGEVLGEAEASAPAPQAPEPSADSADSADADAAAAEQPAAEASDDPTSGQPADAAAESPQRLVTVTIEVEVPDAARAAAFLDALRAGPRLLGIGSTVLASEGEGPLTLTVTAHAFLRTEN